MAAGQARGKMGSMRSSFRNMAGQANCPPSEQTSGDIPALDAIDRWRTGVCFDRNRDQATARVDLEAALDPRLGLERRQIEGGPAPIRVREAAAEARTRLLADAAALTQRKAQLASAHECLLTAAAEVARC